MGCSCDNFNGCGGLLKVLTLIIGFITLVLTAQYYSRPFYQHRVVGSGPSGPWGPIDPDVPQPEQPKEDPEVKAINDAFFKMQNSSECIKFGKAEYKRKNEKATEEEVERNYHFNHKIGPSCVPVKHVVEDELALALIVIVLLLSIVWLLLLFLGVMKNPGMIDMILHIVGGVLLFIAGILWFVSVSARTEKHVDQMKLLEKPPEELAKKAKEKLRLRRKYGEGNMLEYGHPKGDSFVIAPFDVREEQFVALVMDGILILVNALLYIFIGVLALVGRKKNARMMNNQVGDMYQAEPMPMAADEPPPLGLDDPPPS